MDDQLFDNNAQIKAYLKALGVTCLWVAGIITVRSTITGVLDKALGEVTQ